MNPVVVLCIVLMFLPFDDSYSQKENGKTIKALQDRIVDDVNFQNYVKTMSKDLIEVQSFVDGDYIPTYLAEYLDADIDDVDEFYSEDDNGII